MAKYSQVRLAVFGAGKMGGILIEALVKEGLVSPKNLFATVAHAGAERKNMVDGFARRRQSGGREEGGRHFLCVKPQVVGRRG